jgi:sugar-specific transcriptional regulator TrmB
MSQEKVLRTLESVGLSSTDAQLYIFLSKRGPQKARDIAAALKMPKNLLYLSLKNLQTKGIVNVSLERPARFSAEPFEKVLDIFVRTKLEEVEKIESTKAEILSDWQSIAVGINTERFPKFTVLEGRSCINSRLRRMIQEARREILVISSISGLVYAEQSGLLDSLTPNTKLRFLTELSEKDLGALKSFLRQKRRAIEGRVPELGLRLFGRIIIRDCEEAAFFLSDDKRIHDQKSDVCLWTDCDALVNSFVGMFENLWKTSTDVEEKIVQASSCENPLQTCLIVSSREAEAKYHEAIDLSEEEIVMITSSGRLDYELHKGFLEKKTREGVSVKIMVPITGKNFNVAGALSAFCEIRHITPSHVDTTLVDGKHLFQFKSPFSEQDNKKMEYFQNTLYVNDPKYVEKTAAMIQDIWQKAYAPLFVQPEKPRTSVKSTAAPILEEKRSKTYAKVFNFLERPSIPSNTSEKEILSKILNARRRSARNCQEEGITLYGSLAQAFIHPPSDSILPDMMIQVFNNRPQSSFGAAVLLCIYLKTETNQGFSYVPAVMVQTDQGLAKFNGVVNSGTMIEKYNYLFKKSEMEVREQSNSLFVGWVKPIPLPGKDAIPPAGILFEGYGEVRTNVAKLAIANGWQILSEGNSLEAFTTICHPSFGYSGPGTDGLFFRDSIVTYIPPSRCASSA